MTGDEIKALAVKFKPMPDGLNAAEILYFVTMRSLSADFRSRRISAETAKKEGLAARREFDKNAFSIKCWSHSAEMWKNIEMIGTRYAKEHTLEVADLFYRAVYGLGENWRLVPRTQEETK